MVTYGEGKLDGDKWSTQSGGLRRLQWKAHCSRRSSDVGGRIKRRQSNDSLGAVDDDGCVVPILYDVGTWRVT